MEQPFYEQAAQLLRRHPVILGLGFDPAKDINWYGKGADHKDLLQLAKEQRWMIPAVDAEELGYQGVWVHWESCRPGHWVIHCELYPRLSKQAKAKARNYEDLLELKKVITEELRTFGEDDDWPGRFGAHLKRARRDPADPSSLIVWTFDLGLDESCTPEEFVDAIIPIIEGVTPTIDDFVGHLSSDRQSAS